MISTAPGGKNRSVILVLLAVICVLLVIITLLLHADERNGYALNLSLGGLLPGTKECLPNNKDEDVVAECPAEGWLAPTPPASGAGDAWLEMKVLPRPSVCLVRGRWAVEALEPHLNFRRSYALGFQDDVESKAHLLPWLLPAQDPALHSRRRRVFLDLGANRFDTSTYWMLRYYPLDFTEIHAFEAVPERFTVPTGLESPMIWASLNKLSRLVPKPGNRSVADLPSWALHRITAYNLLVSTADADDTDPKSINITRFIKEELKLTKNDAVIVKMDIEEAEWQILESWLLDPEMLQIVDELFVEIHYHDPSMTSFSWNQFKHTREDAVDLFVRLRNAGVMVHAWP